jgi:hypothetical protein
MGSWLSGRATDFDGDGCEDNAEDLDKDNDGVNDSEDRCPFTPLHIHFVSNHASDFDGDGCADGIEDDDDDQDGTVNSVDRCPRTVSWQRHALDSAGCSPEQLDQKAAEEERQKALLLQHRQQDTVEPRGAATWLEWFKTFCNVQDFAFWSVEVVLGEVFIFVVVKGWNVLEEWKQRSAGPPTASVKRLASQAAHVANSWRFISWRSMFLRGFVYSGFFLGMYFLRVTKAKVKDSLASTVLARLQGPGPVEIMS